MLLYLISLSVKVTSWVSFGNICPLIIATTVYAFYSNNVKLAFKMIDKCLLAF